MQTLRMILGTILFLVLANAVSQPTATFAQEKNVATTTDENQQVATIYAATKTAQSAKEYTDLLEDCNRLLSGELSTKNRVYLTSLTGWALNRRGALRFETAQQLAQVGNSQAKDAIAQAMKDLDDAIQADEKRWRSWMYRGIARVELGQFELAIEDFTKAIELNPSDHKALFNRAEASFHAGNFAAAVTDYDAVLENREDDLQALTGRGHAHYALAKFPEACKDYQAVSLFLPENGEALINLGDVDQMLGRWKEANTCYSNALKLAPTEVALQRMAWFQATCPDATYLDTKSAQSLIKQAISLAGETPTSLDTLAAVEAATGNFDVAKLTQQKAIELAQSIASVQPGLKVQASTSDAADSSAKSETVPTEYQTRMAMYQEGVPYRQAKKD